MQQTVRVKICGITAVAAAEHAATVGADAIGLVFYAKSPRFVSDLHLARDIALAAGPFVTVVGLFVDPEPTYVSQVLATVPLGMLQFHGNERNTECIQFGRPYLKALRMSPEFNVNLAITQFPDATGILLDAYRAGVPGGTGETFDWSMIPTERPKPLVLAGGLTPDNVRSAVNGVKPWAVDVSGGVEQSPGVKNPDLVERFVRLAKAIGEY
jgi:phosphoribosylanthranilate isomerase